jgi:ubiquinone/menaquinone biosynthesis C-methylase UbiE
MSRARYDEFAQWYDESVRGETNVGNFALPYLFELMGAVGGRSVLDLACGQGRIARELARHGARVTGVDLSGQLLAIARQHEEQEPLGIHYVQDNAEQLLSIGDLEFDGVVCNMALMDIDDLSAAVSAVRRVLKAGGWFVLNITHPCFQSPGAQWLEAPDGTVSREIHVYFQEGFWRSDNSQGLRNKVGAHHRMLSTYLNAFVAAGFVMARMLEPKAEGIVATQVPGYAVVPAFLMVKLIRPLTRA